MKRKDCTDLFLRGYLDTALFTTDETPPSGVDYVGAGRADEMFDSLPEHFIEQAKADCAKFQAANAELLKRAGDDRQNGSDLWYTRNGHGVGFFDRGYSNDLGEALTKAAYAMGGHDLSAYELGQLEEER